MDTSPEDYIVLDSRSIMQLRAVKDLVVGALIGIVSMLPGASGATIAVIFGIYERLVADVADIRRKLLKDLRFIIPVGLGLVLGMLACAFGLEFLIDRYEIPMMFMFAALILCQIPDIMKLGDDSRPLTVYNVIALALGIAIMVAILIVGGAEESSESQMGSVVTMLIIGIILAISKLAPGISGSSILLALGLYTPFMHAMTDLDISVLLPIGIGFIIGALAFSKVIDHFLRNNRKSTYFMILGLTVGSVITVTVDACMMMSGTDEIVGAVVGIAVGLVFGYILSRVAYKYAKETVDTAVQ